MTESDASLQAHLRAIRTAMAGIGLAILTMGIIGESGLDIFLLIITVLVIAYSFLPTVLDNGDA